MQNRAVYLLKKSRTRSWKARSWRDWNFVPNKDFSRMLCFITDIPTMPELFSDFFAITKLLSDFFAITKLFSDFFARKLGHRCRITCVFLIVIEELQETCEGRNAYEMLKRNAAERCADFEIPATENKRRKRCHNSWKVISSQRK